MRHLLGVIVHAGAIVGAVAAAAGTFLVLVRFSASIPLLLVASSGVCLLSAAAIGWLGARWISPSHRRLLAATAAFVALAVLLVTARSTVWKTMRFPYTPASEPDAVAYWDLDTGSRLAYLFTAAAGETAHPAPVIFVHGGPGLPELMDETVRQRIADAGFDVYTYHQHGAGLSSRATSDRAGEYTVARHVDDLEAIRRRLGAERLILVGQSWGATLSTSYAAAHPERVEKLVLTSPAPIWLPAYEREQILTLNNLSDDDQLELARLIRPYVARLALHRYLTGLNPAAAEAFLSERQLDAFTQAQGEILKRAYVCQSEAARDVTWPGQAYWVNRHVFADLRRIPDPRPRFAEVTAPVLIVRGECDYVDEAIALDFRDAFPNATLVSVEGAGHEIRLERPEAYLEALLAFLFDR